MRFPWRDYQQFCLGVLRWSPSDFWASNVWEIHEAWTGYAKSKGIIKSPKTGVFPDEESRQALRARLERERGNA